MLKRLLFTFFVFACFVSVTSSFCQSTRFIYIDSLHTAGLTPNSLEVVKRNRIEKGVIFRYAFEGKKVKDSFPYRAFFYDTSGKVVREQMLSKTGSVGTTDTFTYDADGSLIKSVMYSGNRIYMEAYPKAGTYISYSDNGVPHVDSSKNWYNEKGELVKYSFFNNSNGYSSLYYYNEDGSPQRIEHYDVSGLKQYSQIYEYLHKRKGWLLTLFTEDVRGRRKVMSCEYNKMKQCTGCIQYYGDGIKESFKYNKDGSLWEYVTDRGNNKKTIERYYYSRY